MCSYFSVRNVYNQLLVEAGNPALPRVRAARGARAPSSCAHYRLLKLSLRLQARSLSSDSPSVSAKVCSSRQLIKRKEVYEAGILRDYVGLLHFDLI